MPASCQLSLDGHAARAGAARPALPPVEGPIQQKLQLVLLDSKRCSKCGETKPLTEFSRERKKSSGYKSACKTCMAVAIADWRVRSKGHVATYDRAWKARNPKLLRASYKRWYARHSEKSKKRAAAWRAANLDRARARESTYRARNPEKAKSQDRAYYLANPEKYKEAQRRREARKKGAEISDLTEADWRTILVEYNNCCSYCGVAGTALEQEHKIPLSRGGNHTKSNVVPACLPCNRSKGTKTDEEFLLWRDRR